MGRPRGLNPIGSREEAVEYLRLKCGGERAQAFTDVATEVIALTRADPIGSAINGPDVDKVVAALRGLQAALRALRPAALGTTLWAAEKVTTISVFEDSTAPSLRELLELVSKWVESIDPTPSPEHEALARLSRYDSKTLLAGWLMLKKLEPRALELVALEMLGDGEPSSV